MSSDQHASALPTSVTSGRHGAVGADLHQDEHPFDDTPASALPADEPRTPGWLPVVGLALLLAALVAVLVSGDETPRSEAPAPAREAAQAANERPADAPVAVRAAPVPGSAGAPPRPQRTPEQRKELQKRIDEARARQVVPPPGGAAPSH